MDFQWSDEKNTLLKKTRNVSFEMVLEEIAAGRILDDSPHPNKDKYPNQSVFVVMLNAYCHLVPYVQEENVIFLKTIIPSRKMMQKYQGAQK